jgi:ribonuclease BN (tRNA processing enzyme)
MNVTILGAHSSETTSARCISMLIDGTLAIDAGALTSSLSLKAQKKLGNVLLTHSHFDHIKDIPLLALNSYRMDARINVYARPSVRAIIQNHLLNGHVYPRFYGLPAKKPTIKFHHVSLSKELEIGGYRVLALLVNHNDGAVGYQVSDAKGKSLFYTSDTGPGLSECWKRVTCQLLIIETTLPNGHEDYARRTGHLTPDLLLVELTELLKIRGELPRIVIVHRDPLFEDEVAEGVAKVADTLKADITIGTEGLRLKL